MVKPKAIEPARAPIHVIHPEENDMPFSLPDLPYAKDALEPHISAETLEYHYGKHHQTYVDKLNGMVDGTPDADKSLEEIIKSASGGLFNNAAQVWNHTFYWHCLSPNGGGTPSSDLAAAIDRDFGSFETFKQKFTDSAIGNFGSGWTWLVQNNDGSLAIVNTDDAETPLTGSAKPLMTCDVWEHAYYIDYRNARPKYMEAFWNLVNWDFVASQTND
jgi:Fe-Mn family superoxide dismutase